MTTKTIVGAGIAAVIIGGIALMAFSLLGWGIGFYNTANSLKVQYESKIEANKSDFDNMKKKISKVAQVSTVQMDKLKDIYTSYAGARKQEGNSALANWVHEAIPNVDTSTFNNIQNIIVAGHDSFNERQKELVDISREYNTLIIRFPGNIVAGIFGMTKIVPLVVTSENTEESFKTRQDNDVKVF